MYDGQECADKRHTEARSLDTEKVGHGFKKAFEVCNNESLQFVESWPQETDIFIYTSIYIVSNVMVTQILR